MVGQESWERHPTATCIFLCRPPSAGDERHGNSYHSTILGLQSYLLRRWDLGGSRRSSHTFVSFRYDWSRSTHLEPKGSLLPSPSFTSPRFSAINSFPVFPRPPPSSERPAVSLHRRSWHLEPQGLWWVGLPVVHSVKREVNLPKAPHGLS